MLSSSLALTSWFSSNAVVTDESSETAPAFLVCPGLLGVPYPIIFIRLTLAPSPNFCTNSGATTSSID